MIIMKPASTKKATPPPKVKPGKRGNGGKRGSGRPNEGGDGEGEKIVGDPGPGKQ
jgi:hypothetical protein